MSRSGYQAPSRDELANRLTERVESAAQSIAASQARRAKQAREHEEWIAAMRAQRENMQRRRLAGTDVHGVQLGRFRMGKFFPFDGENEK